MPVFSPILACLLLWLFSFFGCAGQSKHASKVAAGKTEAVSETSTTNLEISDPSSPLNGAAAQLPPGTLAVGSVIELDATVDQPTSFANAKVDAANLPISVLAKDSGGAIVTEVASPMTIKLPYSEAALVDRNADNLCIFLEWAGDQSVFVWRRSSLSLQGAEASFETTRLGVFQLVYCGNSALDSDFKDAQAEGISGAAGTKLASLSLAQSDASFQFDHSHICVGAAVISDAGVREVWSYKDYAHTPLEALDLAIYKGGVKDLTTLDDAKTVEIYVIFQDSTQLCNTSIFSSKNPAGKALFAWYKTGKQLKALSLSGRIGDTSGSFGLESVNVQIGRTDGSAQAAAHAADVCLGSYVSGALGGYVQISTSITADYKINGSSFKTLYFMPLEDSSVTKKSYMTFNSKKCDGDDSNDIGEYNTAQVFTAFFRDFTAGQTLAFMPIDMTLNLASIYPRVCVQIFAKDTDVSNMTDDQKNAVLLASLLVNDAETSAYKFYVPFRDSGVYNISYKVFSTENKNCSKTSSLMGSYSNITIPSSYEVKYP